jgi:subtilisin family serine protease
VRDIANYLSPSFVVGRTSSPFAVYGTVETDSLLSLASSPAVSYVFPDVKLVFDRMKPDPEVYTQHLAADMFKIRQIIGADRVNQLGISGQNVTIAIVDTGTDFTIPDLRDAVARNSLGQAITFDADGQSLVITNLTVTRFGSVLTTAGKDVKVWNAASYVDTSPSEAQIETVKLNYNYVAPTVLSKSGTYHFGILREEISDVISGSTVDMDFPVVVIDAHQAGVYDTVVVDMSTAYYNFLENYRDKLNANAGQTLGLNLTWPSPKFSWDDHGFADEQPHSATPGNDLISFDPNGSDVPVFSAGSLAYGIDLSGYSGEDMALLPPIDPKGNFINVFFDCESHGTSTASDAASRGILKRDVYQNGTLFSLPGIAPAAKVMGVKALWLGDTTFAWYYAAGFDWNPTNFSFKYTGMHRADIISNSWGDSDPIADLGSTFGADLESQLADALSLPRYLDPAYPGAVMLIAAGNGGFGYGTVTSPAAGPLPITIGASTSYAYRTQPKIRISHEIDGSYDEVVPWSARGPTSIGEPKPDVVDVGAFSFTDQATFTGYGNGTSAYTIFGGTSMATPVTAGAVALIIQEYRNTHGGETPSPDLVKSILASSATDLSYDPFTQGSGRVNVWAAVAAAAEGRDSRFPKRFYAFSTATWDTTRELLANSWALNFQTPIPSTSQASTNWFVGIAQPGTSKTASFTVMDATQPSAVAYVYTLIGTTTSQHLTNTTVVWIPIPKDSIPANADLMKVTLVYHFSDFVNQSSWDYRNLLIAQIYDTNFDSQGHVRRITNGAPYSTTSELVVGRPLTKFEGTPAVRVLKQGSQTVIKFELVIRYYQRSKWDWISQISTTQDLTTVTMAVPDNATPGVYGGFIALADNGTVVLIPVSVVVPITLSGTYGETSSNAAVPYDNFAFYGAFDWSWRYEAGDWRTYIVMVPQGFNDIKVTVTWSDTQTDIQAHLTGPEGFLLASSEYPSSHYVSSGKFNWHTSTGGPAEVISASGMSPGIYFVVLHNTLYGGSFLNYPENFTLTVEMT